MRTSFHSRARSPRGRRVAGRGFMLVEVLVGLMIFTIGVLGLVGVQAAMVRAQTSANFRAEAAQLASDLVGRMWLDTANLDVYLDTARCKASTNCGEWMSRVETRLPGGVAPVVTKSGEQINIAISWVVPGETDNGGLHVFRTVTSVTPQPKATP